MAIKTPHDMDTLQLTVTLKDGTVIGPADTTQQPFGNSERIVAVWQGDVVAIYPLDLVQKVEMSFAG